MRAIVIKQHGGAGSLVIEERSDPEPQLGYITIEVKAFGIHHAEIYFREGAWGDVAEISGIECVGIVRADPSGALRSGQKVLAIVGGMGRNLSGSYAELTNVPISNVAAINTDLSWEAFAAIPESYATAWTCLIGILSLTKGQKVLIRGATSALGQAAVNIANHAGAQVIATTRNFDRIALLKELGADQAIIDRPDLSEHLKQEHPDGLDSALDIVGNTTVLDSAATLKRGGQVCLAGFLGGGGPLEFEPVFQLPSGRLLSVFASAVATGTPDFPLSEIPFQNIVDRAASGVYSAKPVRVFEFDEIQDAHRLLESGTAGGKIVVRI